jgi:hypothetical protein
MIDEKAMLGAIEKEIRRQIDNIVDAEVKTLHARVEEKVRASVGAIVARVLTHYSVQTFGRELVIKVDFDGTKEL